MFDSNESSELLLEECIQALIDGEDWRGLAQSQAAEVAPLVAVGHWLLELARNVPPATTEGRARIWRRISDSIDVGRLAAMLRPGSGSIPDNQPGVPANL